MTTSTIVRTLAVLVAVPVLVLAQGYLDVRTDAAANGVLLDASTTQITGVTDAIGSAWLPALFTVVLTGALVLLVLPGRGATAIRALPLLVATALLATIVVIGQNLADALPLVTYLEQEDPEPVPFWLQEGARSPVMPLMLGALLALTGWTLRPRIRSRETTTT